MMDVMLVLTTFGITTLTHLRCNDCFMSAVQIQDILLAFALSLRSLVVLTKGAAVILSDLELMRRIETNALNLATLTGLRSLTLSVNTSDTYLCVCTLRTSNQHSLRKIELIFQLNWFSLGGTPGVGMEALDDHLFALPSVEVRIKLCTWGLMPEGFRPLAPWEARCFETWIAWTLVRSQSLVIMV